MSQEEECRQALREFSSGRTAHALQGLRGLSLGGYAPAQVLLGWILERGHGGSAEGEARRWYTAAAEAGDAVGAYYLGLLLLREENTEAGLRWVENAASQEYAPALNLMAQFYKNGQNVTKNDLVAAGYLNRAAERGHLGAQRQLALRRMGGSEGMRGRLRGALWFLSSPFVAFRLSRQSDFDENLLP